ncbi:hypothetical protein LCGC14_0963300 [marine sediment metagenome]|uniref:Uncharacterized protein n=1 Tax=marine sediment metagenome TaxID=412755 RepID=A0A0F9NZX1_9ZZZZ
MDWQEKFKGREFWRSLNLVIIMVLYTILFFGMILFPKYLWWMLLGVAIFIPSYGIIYITHTKNIELSYKGSKIFLSWVEHEHGVGEEFTPFIKDIQEIDKLSEEDIKAVDKYEEKLIAMSKEKIQTGVGDTPQKQLTYIEITENEENELIDYKKEYLKMKNRGETDEEN